MTDYYIYDKGEFKSVDFTTYFKSETFNYSVNQYDEYHFYCKLTELNYKNLYEFKQFVKLQAFL